MKDSSVSIAIMEFATLDEIQAIEGISPSYVFDKEQYRSIIGEYHLTNGVKCCLKKDQKACKHEHKYGFIVRLSNGVATLVGNVCANENFEAESTFKRDRKNWQDQKASNEKLELITEAVSREKELRTNIARAEKALNNCNHTVNNLQERLGTSIAEKLTQIGRTQKSLVTVNLSTTKKSTDPETGEITTENRVFPFRLGELKGCALFSGQPQDALRSEVRNLRLALKSAKETLAQPDRASLKKINEVSASLSRTKNLSLLTQGLEVQTNLLLSNDPMLYCFLDQDRSSRYRAAKLYLEKNNLPSGKNHSKNAINELENKIKQANAADKLWLI